VSPDGRLRTVIGEGFRKSCSTQVIIAALNEEPGIGPTITELVKYVNPQHVIVVDGHSSDRTAEIAKECGADILLQDGFGKGDAISKAINCADLNANYVVLTDADYTYPAEYVPEMIAILHQNPRVGMVCGNRFNGQVDPRAWRSSFYFGNRFLASAHNLLNGVALRDPLTGLRVVRAEILKNWSVKSKGFDVEVELNHQVERKGFHIIEVPIKYRPRLGAKKLKIRDGATILKRILLETF
jgi:glycosyltransferase involved in cell wall biosynthesis